MGLFVIAAGIMAVLHLVLPSERPRLAIFVSGALWLLYAVYEYYVATGVLCDADCNIRVDLVFFWPILGLAAFCAYQSYQGQPGQMKVIGTVLGVVALLAAGLVAEDHGYPAFEIIVGLGALAYGIHVVRSKRSSNQS
jgi:peptidoglycan/LPS O-acetylase OafA/YrhL